MEFAKEEISRIEKKLGFIVFDWAKHLIDNVINKARGSGVKVVYMNTKETLDAGAITDPKTDYFYERLPPLLGFKKEQASLRGKGDETLWAFHLDSVNASSLNKLIRMAKQVSINDIPPKYQGAFIKIIGRQDYYNEAEIQRVIDIVSKNEKSNKSMSKYFYDWDSKTWSGGQQFDSRITENVVLQRVTSEIQNMIQEDPALLKFWSLILSQNQHFGSDVIGFGLVSKVSNDYWVINEIQTDAINAYMKLRRIDQNNDKEGSMTWETIRDMLVANNKSKWAEKAEASELFKNQLIQNPNLMHQLPDDSVDIEKWITENVNTGVPGMTGLMEHFQSVNFNSRIFKTY